MQSSIYLLSVCFYHIAKYIFFQAGALVHIYTDGSVLLTHGGTEMGQGLHTKMIQVKMRYTIISACKCTSSFQEYSEVQNSKIILMRKNLT